MAHACVLNFDQNLGRRAEEDFLAPSSLFSALLHRYVQSTPLSRSNAKSAGVVTWAVRLVAVKGVYYLAAVPIIKLFAWGRGIVRCVFITAVPITKLFARGGRGEWRTCATRDYEPRPL
jgi:hypothetical protein